MSIENFSGDVAVYELGIKLGQPVISSNKQTIQIPYIGTSDPASATVALAKYKFSLDNGVTYSDMTPVSAADTANLSFDADGNNLVFNWDAKVDLGTDLYNKPFRVLLQASEFGLTSAEVSRYVIFNRVFTNSAALRARKVFPDNYEGISGRKFRQEKLPGIN